MFHFWMIVAGGKYDFTAKWWNPASYQKVVDHFQGRIQFIQCGEAGHWHPPLTGVINLVGKTDTRQFVRLMHHADGVVCPVTFAMHLAAAVETRPGHPKHRPCVVIAGGREPTQWEAYPNHQYLSTTGMLSCSDGGCWKSRCQLVGDGDPKDQHDVCEQPVQLTPELRIPKCLDMITAEDVIRKIELYLQGEATQKQLFYSPPLPQGAACQPPPPTNAYLPEALATATTATPAQHDPTTTISIKTPAAISRTSVAFYHGLGDCAYFAHLIPLYVRRGHAIEVECTPDKAVLFKAAGATTITSGAQTTHPWGYPGGGTHEGQGHFCQGSKMGHNLSEPPLPFIGNKAELWDEFVASRIDITSHLAPDAVATVERWLERLSRPVVLLHSRGNTGQERKSLPNDTTEQFYREFIDRCDGTLILLDWDNRVPRLASARVRHLSDLGPCPTDVMFQVST